MHLELLPPPSALTPEPVPKRVLKKRITPPASPCFPLLPPTFGTPRISSTPDLLRMVLNVCEGVSDVQVDPANNAIKVISAPRRGRPKPDPAELLRHLDEIGLGLKFIVARRVSADCGSSSSTPEKKRTFNGQRLSVSDHGSVNGRVEVVEKRGNGSPARKAKIAPSPTGEPRVVGAPVVLLVKGMMCQKNCGTTAEKALRSVPGVVKAEVSFAEKRARVWRICPGPVDALVEALESVGFESTVPPNVELEVEGMMCQKNCGSTVCKALEAVPGVYRAEVSFAERRARVWGTEASADALVDAVETVGFGAAVKPVVVVLDVEGMMCQKNCGSTVRKALEAVPGAHHAEVSFAEKRAKVWGASGLKAKELVEAVEAVGFEAGEPPAIELEVQGMMCQKNCGTTVQNALEAVHGVTRTDVSFAQKRARVWLSSPAEVSSDVLVDAVSAAGFEACPVASSPSGEGPSPMAITASSNAIAGKDASQRQSLKGTTQDPLDPSARRRSRAPRSPGIPRVSSTARGDGEKSASGGKRVSTMGGGVAHPQQRLSTGTFAVEGMSCAACVGNVEKYVSAMQGVAEVRVALLAGQVRLRSPAPFLDIAHAPKTLLAYRSSHQMCILSRVGSWRAP